MNQINQIIAHEVGHWLVAKSLGYEGYIYAKDDIHHFYVPITSPSQDTINDCTKGVLIALGGKAAENISGFEQSAGFLQDLNIALGYLKIIGEKAGNPLPYQKINYLPFQAYESYLKKSENIITELGGANIINKLTNNVLKDLGY